MSGKDQSRLARAKKVNLSFMSIAVVSSFVVMYDLTKVRIKR